MNYRSYNHGGYFLDITGFHHAFVPWHLNTPFAKVDNWICTYTRTHTHRGTHPTHKVSKMYKRVWVLEHIYKIACIHFYITVIALVMVYTVCCSRVAERRHIAALLMDRWASYCGAFVLSSAAAVGRVLLPAGQLCAVASCLYSLHFSASNPNYKTTAGGGTYLMLRGATSVRVRCETAYTVRHLTEVSSPFHLN